MDDDIELALFSEGDEVAVYNIHDGFWYVRRKVVKESGFSLATSFGYRRTGLEDGGCFGLRLDAGGVMSGVIVILTVLIFFTNPT
jgi:hypothetical protein